MAATGKGLRKTTLEDVQGYLEGIGGPPARAAAVRAIKSLFRFAHTLGLLRKLVNVYQRPLMPTA